MSSSVKVLSKHRPVKAGDIIPVVRKLADIHAQRVYTRPAGYSHSSYRAKPDMRDGGRCIVGLALATLNREVERRSDWKGIAMLAEEDLLHGTALQLAWLDAVQGRQDLGRAWGDCLRYADAKYGEVDPLPADVPAEEQPLEEIA